MAAAKACSQEGSRNEETKSGGSKGGNYEKATGCCRTSASRSRRSAGFPRRSAACRSRRAPYERVKLRILPAGRYRFWSAARVLSGPAAGLSGCSGIDAVYEKSVMSMDGR